MTGSEQVLHMYLCLLAVQPSYHSCVCVNAKINYPELMMCDWCIVH